MLSVAFSIVILGIVTKYELKCKNIFSLTNHHFLNIIISLQNRRRTLTQRHSNQNFIDWTYKVIKEAELTIHSLSGLMNLKYNYLYNMINGFAIFTDEHFNSFCNTLKLSDEEVSIGALFRAQNNQIDNTKRKKDDLEIWILKTLERNDLKMSDLPSIMKIKYATLYAYIAGKAQITFEVIESFCIHLKIPEHRKNIFVILAKRRTINRIMEHKLKKTYDKFYYWFYCELWMRGKTIDSFISSCTTNKSRSKIISQINSSRPIDEEMFEQFCKNLNLNENEISEGKKYQELRKLHLERSSENNKVDAFDDRLVNDYTFNLNSTIPHSLLSLIVSGKYREDYTVESLLKLNQTLETLKQSVSLTEETIKQIIKEYFENSVLEPSE